MLDHVGVAPTGDSFNAILLDEVDHRAPNPMVNAGAIAVTDLVAGADLDERVETVRSMYERYLGRKPEIDHDVWASERATGDLICEGRASPGVEVGVGRLPTSGSWEVGHVHGVDI